MLMNTIQLVQRNLNPALKLEGVLMTMYDSRTNLSQDVVNEVQKYFKNKNVSDDYSAKRAPE